MCLAHSGTPSDALHVEAGVGTDAAEAFAALAEAGGLGSTEITGSGTPDAVGSARRAGARRLQPGPAQTSATRHAR